MAVAGAASPLTTPRILWGNFLVSVVLFLGMTFIVPQDPELAFEPIMAPVFGGVAVMSAVMSFVVPGIIVKPALANADVKLREVPDPNASIQVSGKTPTIKVVADPRAFRQRAYAMFLTPWLLAVALSESVAIFGLVLHFMGASLPIIAPFFAVSFLLIAMRFPTEKAIIKPLLDAKQARLLDDLPPA